MYLQSLDINQLFLMFFLQFIFLVFKLSPKMFNPFRAIAIAFLFEMAVFLKIIVYLQSEDYAYRTGDHL